ncbi:MAG: LysM peptidoglycan-binding domain-containing protein [Acholeplasma sp.]|nr:LysM peptidoglycan-binding domain-containing protein [Acholeplasma sp.]
MNCPVCNKSGLPDYTNIPVICPQCNSDLKGFIYIKQTSTNYSKSVKNQKFLISFSVLMFLILLISLFFHPFIKQKEDIQIATKNNDSIIIELSTELAAKELEIKELKYNSSNQQDINFLYIVKKGDNLSKIAYFFYNDWEMYKKIETDNNLKHGSLILPNDTLILKIKLK